MNIAAVEHPRSRREELGQFLTAPPVADFMASMFGPLPQTVRLLDAGAGAGALTQAFVSRCCENRDGVRAIEATLYELDCQSRFKLRKGKEEPPSIICVGCEQRVPLWDEMEQCFASPEIQQRVRDLQEESAIELSNQSKERALVGEVISTVALADQISREFNVSDQGIDLEIEFTDDAHEATGAKLYLQLKSGDSYLRERKSDGAEIFTIKDERHARYWMAQAFPVLLVIRNSKGEVRRMEVRDWLKRASDHGRKPIKQIIFAGERFDVMSVRRWRERVLADPGANRLP